MRVEWIEFLLAFCGGLVISLATSMNLLLKGRITGMSSMIAGVISNEGTTWKISVLSGMVITSSVSWMFFGFDAYNNGKTHVFDPPASVVSKLDLIGFTLAGLLVGIGTRLGNGCTSGHGVCGLPRLSLRSYVAVGVFMAFGIAVATLRGLFPFLNQTEGAKLVSTKINYGVVVPIILVVAVALYLVYLAYLHRYQILDLSEVKVSFITGVLFAIGLIMSGMAKREKVLGFLTFNENWDPSLALVMAGAAIPNFITFHYILQRDRPVFAQVFEVPPPSAVNFQLVAGAAIFGAGWGLGGICPGPAYILAPIFTPHISVLFLASLFLGFFLVMLLQKNDKTTQQYAKYTDQIEQQ